jgi:metal transporter CNNM
VTLSHPAIWIWAGIAVCILHSALFSGLNLGLFSISRLRLEIAADIGNQDAITVRQIRRNSNRALATIIWGNAGSNVILTLLSGSVLSGVASFAFSTVVITWICEIIPQAYFSRHSLRMSSRLAPLLRFYSFVLSPVTAPTAALLNWLLGPEGLSLLRERDVRALIARHVEAGGEVSRLEGIGARNFLDLDDIPICDEGEPLDSLSVITLPLVNGKPELPGFKRSSDDPFLRKINASGRKWVVILGDKGQPVAIVDSHRFLRDAFFGASNEELAACFHQPILVTDANATLGDVIGRFKVFPEKSGDDVIDEDVVLVWTKEHRIITGADLLGRLLRGIVQTEKQNGH